MATERSENCHCQLQESRSHPSQSQFGPNKEKQEPHEPTRIHLHLLPGDRHRDGHRLESFVRHGHGGRGEGRERERGEGGGAPKSSRAASFWWKLLPPLWGLIQKCFSIRGDSIVLTAEDQGQSSAEVEHCVQSQQSLDRIHKAARHKQNGRRVYNQDWV